MSIRTVLALSGAIVLLSPTAVVGQIRVTSEQAAQATARATTSAEASRRASDILTAFLTDPGITAATAAEELAGAITARTDTTSAERADLERLYGQLVAFAPMAGDGTPREFAFADRTVRETATVVRGAIDVLDKARAIPAAVASGDDARFQEAYRAFLEAPLLLNRHQALVMRSQAEAAPAGSTVQSKLMAMACVSDGNVAAQQAAAGAMSGPEAAMELSEAEACVRLSVAEGRERLARPPADPDAQALLDRLRPSESALFDAIEDQAGWISSVRAGLEAGEAPDGVLQRLQPEFEEYQRRVHAQVAETNAVVAQYNQSPDRER